MDECKPLVMGLYFLSSVLLIRDKLPDRYKGFITEVRLRP